MKIRHLIVVALLPLFSMNGQNFSDNFDNDEMNSFPSQWDLVFGEAKVALVDTKKLLELEDNAIVKPRIEGESSSYLKDEFTIEFDAFFDDAGTSNRQFYKIRFWDGKGNFRFNEKHTDPFLIYRHRIYLAGSIKSDNLEAKLDIKEEGWRQIKITYSKGELRMYINGHLLYENPNLFYKPKMISIGIRLHSSRDLRSGITNFSFIGETEKNLDGECGAVPTEQQLQVLVDSTSLFNRRLKFIENFSIEDLRGLRMLEYRNDEFVMPTRARFSSEPTDDYSVIPIAAHILRKSNHREGLTLDDLYASINKSNELLDQYGVFLQIDNIKYINDDELYNKSINDTTDVDSNDIADYIELLDVTEKDIPNKLNIYFVENSYTSWASFPSKSNRKQHIIMKNSQARNESTLTHEIGHWFNLLHTHETVKGVEDINGNNCSKAGDLCCDTPADPKLSGKVDDSCNYTANDTDASGSSFSPDPTNLMSYSRKECRDVFSGDQIKRMYNAYLGMEQDRGYLFEVNNQIGQKIQELSLNPGWKAVEHFENGGNTFMLFFNEDTNEIAIYQLKPDGTKGERVAYKKYRGSMSTAKVFRKGPNRYLMMISYSLGQLGIIKLNVNGTLGAVKSYQIESGWTNSIIKNVGNPSYLALFNSNIGKVVTYPVTSDGSLGAKAYEKLTGFPFNYDIIEVVKLNILCYDSQTGKVARTMIDSSGMFRIISSNSSDLGENWSALKFAPLMDNYGNSVDNILILNKANGQIKQYHWNENYSFGDSWYDSDKIGGNLASGYDVVVPYQVFDGSRYQNYAMFSNSTSGKTLTYHINNNN